MPSSARTSLRQVTAILQNAARLLVILAMVAFARAGNPIITNVFTADPAALVHNDTVYLYVGQDDSPIGAPWWHMPRWLCYSSTDMKTWTAHGSPIKPTDFSWAVGDAWAAHVTEKNGRFYFYSSVRHNDSNPGLAIGVAVSDSPTGPFVDARGSALITPDNSYFDDIDPAVFTDADGTSWIFWGNTQLFYAKLKPNMIELDGPAMRVEVPWFTEGPWIHKRGDLYYLSYPSEWPEKLVYCTGPSIHGPWTFRGTLSDYPANSFTIHQAIIDFKGQSYLFYHNGTLPNGDGTHRSVCVDYLHYNPNGTIKQVVQTSQGTDVAPSPVTPDRNIVPTWNRLQSYNFPEYFAYHWSFQGRMGTSPFTDMANPIRDAYLNSMWTVVPGLSNSGGVSFESIGFPGRYLRFVGADLVVEPFADTAAFKESATFEKVPGLADPKWSSFRSFSDPTKYLRHSNFVLYMNPVFTNGDKADATFRLTYEGGPDTRDVPDGTYYLTPQHAPGKALSVLDAVPDNGAKLGIKAYSDANSQKFLIDRQIDGTYRIRTALAGNRAVDLPFGNTSNGTKAQLWDANGNSAQRWYLVALGNGSYTLTPKNDVAKSLDVKDNSTADGAWIHSWDYFGGANQQWTLTPTTVVVAAPTGLTATTGPENRERRRRRCLPRSSSGPR